MTAESAPGYCAHWPSICRPEGKQSPRVDVLMLQSGAKNLFPWSVTNSTLLVAVAQDAGAVKVVVSGPRLLKVCPERVVAVGNMLSSFKLYLE